MLTVDQIERLSKAWMAWIFGYLLLGMLAVSQSRTFFVAAAIDEPLPLWFKAAFLNLPLQMALALAAVVLVKRMKADPPSVPRPGAGGGRQSSHGGEPGRRRLLRLGGIGARADDLGDPVSRRRRGRPKIGLLDIIGVGHPPQGARCILRRTEEQTDDEIRSRGDPRDTCRRPGVTP